MTARRVTVRFVKGHPEVNRQADFPLTNSRGTFDTPENYFKHMRHIQPDRLNQHASVDWNVRTVILYDEQGGLIEEWTT